MTGISPVTSDEPTSCAKSSGAIASNIGKNLMTASIPLEAVCDFVFDFTELVALN